MLTDPAPAKGWEGEDVVGLVSRDVLDGSD